MKLVELGTIKGKRIIAIPKGMNESGWDGFVRKTRKPVGSSSFVFVYENICVFNKGATNRVSKGKEASLVTSHREVSYSHEASYLSALMETVKDNRGPSKLHGKDNFRKDVIVSTVRNKKVGSKEVIWRNLPDDGDDSWHLVTLQKLREVERSFWHVWVELLGWKDRLDSMLKIVDEGLGLIMGLGHVSNGNKEATEELKGGRFGPKAFKVNKGVGLDRGPFKRLV